MNQSSLIKNIHLGIKKTNELYMGWTGGWWLTAYGVENTVQVNGPPCFVPKTLSKPSSLAESCWNPSVVHIFLNSRAYWTFDALL